jgi:hypothetical protein
METETSPDTRTRLHDATLALTDSANRDRESLLTFLADRDILCPICKYNLRQLQSTKCPECGSELKLSVGAVDVRMGLWVSALLAAAAPATFGLLFLIIIIASGEFPSFRYVPVSTMLLMLYVLAAIPATVFLIAGRRSFLRRGLAVQRACAVVPWLCNVAIVIYLLAEMLRW